MNTPDEIKRQLDQLDIEFESPQNQKSNKLTFDKWTARRIELVQQLRHAERVGRTEPTAPTAPALSVRDLDTIFWPPKIPDLATADRAELRAFSAAFDEALLAGDIEGAREIQKNPRRAALGQESQIANVAQLLRHGYAGVRMFATMVTGAVATVMNELAEARMGARVLRARIDALERKQRSGPDDIATELNDRTLRLSFSFGDRVISKDVRLPIPIFRGAYRSGEKYAQHDVIVSGGSQWIALKDTKDRPPSDAWQQVTRGLRS